MEHWLSFSRENIKLWPILAHFGHFDANIRIYWCTFIRLIKCGSVLKLTNIRYAFWEGERRRNWRQIWLGRKNNYALLKASRVHQFDFILLAFSINCSSLSYMNNWSATSLTLIGWVNDHEASPKITSLVNRIIIIRWWLVRQDNIIKGKFYGNINILFWTRMRRKRENLSDWPA